MKKLLFYACMGSLILMLGCSENSPLLPGDEPVQQESLKKSAKKPMATLVGHTVENMYVDADVSPLPFSVGTITFNDVIYGLIYDIQEMNPKEHILHFTETFYIYPYEEGKFDITNPEFNIAEILAMDYLMTGTNTGVSPTGKMFVTNGEVSEAYEPFEGWAGRKTHVIGDILDDGSIVSTFKIN